MEFFLSNGVTTEEIGREERKQLGVRSRAYCLFHGNLYHKSADRIWRRVVQTDDQEEKLTAGSLDATMQERPRQESFGRAAYAGEP